ncbi:MAG: tRNA (adenosine(37)-N6)-threonylcarbamoyltransferase complex ATPase subunit type 1 TsaE [Ignavibacteriae bacterium]|nr:tRNA (adenosine(37)-N6)-threonylcarbamoyltransferase complex ATPase subunit type 1 TsaE [Ignavibacteriota bacterium]
MKTLIQKEIHNLFELDKIAFEISNIIKNGDVILLEGNLGSGKTTLVKSICLNYGIENVVSPSFAIVNEYFGKVQIYHFDFYRIKKAEELYDIGFHDYLNNEDSVKFIEWAELFPEILPKNFIKIIIKQNENDVRKIVVIRNE